ncbi:hypothetical protein JXL19_06390 [bacterium]|nr:hypothetical protein [bacterium]
MFRIHLCPGISQLFHSCFEHCRSDRHAFAEWKSEKGFLTKVVTLDDINVSEGGTTAANIRAYINRIYNTQHLSYVLLFK